MDRQEAIDGIVAKCEEDIELLAEKVRIAWSDMDKMRCPLSMTGTDLADEIEECMEDWFCDQDLTEEEIEELDIDVEEDIFMNLEV